MSGRGHPGKTAEKVWKFIKKEKCHDKGRNRSFGFVVCILSEVSLYLGKWGKSELKKERAI